MRTVAPTAVAQDGPTATGWFLSCLLHGGLVVVALLFVQRLQLLPETESFQWNVAMVVPAPSMATNPSTPSHDQAAHPSVKQSPPAPSPSPSPSTSAHRQSEPTITEPAQTTAHETTPNPLPVEPTSASVGHDLETQSAFTPIHHEQPPHVAASTPQKAPESDSLAAATSAQPFTDQTSPNPSTKSDSEPTPQMAALVPTIAQNQSKQDFAWLSAVITRRIEESKKRYPADARLDSIEGRAIVRFVLREDGSINDVEISQSSGNQSLDEAAVEVVKQSSPIHLPRPLGVSKKTIVQPIRFRIDR